jgi:hypothetical protein
MTDETPTTLPEVERRWRVRDGTPPLKPSAATYGPLSPPSSIYAPVLYTDGDFGGEILPVRTLAAIIETLDALFEAKPYIYILWVGGTVIENINPEPRPSTGPLLPPVPEEEVPA